MLPLKQANVIIDGAFAKALDDGIPPLAVVVLDEAGNVVSAQRQDGASMFRMDVAKGKAWGAVGMGVASRTLAQRANDNPNFFIALAATAHGNLLAQPGAVLIRDAQGRIIGAAGASGGTGDQDEACCIHGIERAGLATDEV